MVPRCHEQRADAWGMVFHVLNRGVAGMQLFEKAADHQAFDQVCGIRLINHRCGFVRTR